METIKIKYHSDAIDKLDYIDGKSDWIDLRAAEEVEFKAGEFKLINLGVSMKLPEGYEAHVAPRSSTFNSPSSPLYSPQDDSVLSFWVASIAFDTSSRRNIS